MVSRRKLLCGLSAVLLAVGTAGATSASASGPGAAECVVFGGNLSITSGGGIQLRTPHTDTFFFFAEPISCSGSDADDNGNWRIAASGTSTDETCAKGTGGGSIDGGTSPGDGNVTGGSFTFVRAAAAVVVEGTVTTAGETHTFAAKLVFTARNGECSGDLSRSTTLADINGTAEIAE